LWTKDCGNPGCGALVLAWINGSCQANWAGESFWLHGQLARDREWFEPLEPSKQDLIQEIEKLRKQVESLSYTIDFIEPRIEAELRRGGYGESGFEVIELVGMETIDLKPTEESR